MVCGLGRWVLPRTSSSMVCRSGFESGSGLGSFGIFVFLVLSGFLSFFLEREESGFRLGPGRLPESPAFTYVAALKRITEFENVALVETAVLIDPRKA